MTAWNLAALQRLGEVRAAGPEPRVRHQLKREGRRQWPRSGRRLDFVLGGRAQPSWGLLETRARGALTGAPRRPREAERDPLAARPEPGSVGSWHLAESLGSPLESAYCSQDRSLCARLQHPPLNPPLPLNPPRLGKDSFQESPTTWREAWELGSVGVSVSGSRVLICLLVCVLSTLPPKLGEAGTWPAQIPTRVLELFHLSINSVNRHLWSTYHICELESP